jgi:hypothetical protein
MHSVVTPDSRTAEIAKTIQTERDVALIRQHVKEVVEGTAFRGSRRSGQFLAYVVEQSIAGHLEALKERVIGVELFGRSPSYDTGEDAIVRVTASEVRRRLLQHYGQYGTASEVRISLHSGSYVPEMTLEPKRKGELDEENGVRRDSTPASDTSVGRDSTPSLTVTSHVDSGQKSASGAGRRIPWIAVGIVLSAINIAILIVRADTFWGVHSTGKAVETTSVLPWSAFFNSQNSTYLVLSDPTIETVQEFTGQQISTSDYANHNYIPEPNTLSAETKRLSNIILRGDNPAEVDTPIALNIARIAQARSRKIMVRGTRAIQLADLKNDDNFIFLGSPRSNPWSALFSDQLDFKFVFDKRSNQEIIQNVRPRRNELQSYVPTALGWATGQSFAIVALVQNPDQNGHVLLLAGANAEGTEAAGRIVTDDLRLPAILQQCGISATGPLQKFEILLRLNTMAGSPSNFEVLACHLLPPGTSNH